MSISKGMLAHSQHFNQVKVPLNIQSTEEKKGFDEQETSENRYIQLLEIYVEKSKSMTLGQRLSWHLNLINKKIHLPCIPDENEFYLKAVNVTFKEDLNQEQHNGHLSEQLQAENSALYCQDSNTVFYYSEYKVLLLIDFSKSTSTIYPHQSKSYAEKLQESIEIFIHNLWFKLNNKYHNNKKGPLRSQNEDLTQPHYNHDLARDTSPLAIHTECPKGFNQIIQEVNDESDEINSPLIQEEKNGKESIQQEIEVPNEYNPTIYLSIVASGLPPSNNMKILVHNQKLDDNNRNEVLKSLHSRLLSIEQQLCQSFNSQNYEQVSPSSNPLECQYEVKQEDYLQRHLCNAQSILNMMKTGAKPLLVLFTDSTSSLLGRGSGREGLDNTISRLHAADTKIITVDLGNENKVGNTFGYVNHDEHLKYLAYVTCGAHFDYAMLIKLAGIFSENYNGQQLFVKHYASLSNNLERISSINQESKILHQNSVGLGILDSLSHNKLNNLAGIKAGSIMNINNGLKYSKQSAQKQHKDLSQNDQFHSHLNSLQKLMFARPCNYSRFLQFSEIQQLVNYQERLIFENRVSTDLIKRLVKDKDLTVNPSFSVSELLLNGRYVPIFRKEQLSEYRLESCSRASQICEYRSRMCFQFRKLKVVDQKHSSSPLDRPGSKIYYQYWWSNQILILCCIEQIRTIQNLRQVHVTYKLVAQEEVINQIKRDRKELFSKSNNSVSKEAILNNNGETAQPKLLVQLQDFLLLIQKCDQNFEVFEAIQSDIKRTFSVVHQRQTSFPGKYIQKIGCQQLKSLKFQNIEIVGMENTKLSEDNVNKDGQKNQPENISQQSKQKIAASEEEAIKIYQRHRKYWHKLLKIAVCHWLQIFIYKRLDIVTQSSLEQVVVNGNRGCDLKILMDQANNQDNQIQLEILEKFISFTSFQINNDTFIQVFQDHRSAERIIYGFCIIRVQWAAHNIIVCHLGFYQVSPKIQSEFTNQLKKVLTAENQKVYEKQVASLLVQESKAFIKYKILQNEQRSTPSFEQSFMKVKKDKIHSFYHNQVPASVSDLCYNKQWLWKNENALTNKDFLETIIRQRLKEGFIFVNRDQQDLQQSSKFLFIKLLKAYKQKIGKIGQLSRNSNRLSGGNIFYYQCFIDSENFGKLGNHKFQKLAEDYQIHTGQNEMHHCNDSSNEFDIVLQYVISLDRNDKNLVQKTQQNQSEGQCSFQFQTELLMEHESGFFFIDKYHNCHQNFGSNISLENLLKKDQDQVNCLADKNFFPKLSEYIFEVDKFLFNNICTYHNIIKNSISKMVEIKPSNQNSEYLIKSEVCYFKNIFTEEVEQALQSNKSRKRLKLESSIKSKMQMLKSDWGEFLRNSYPELLFSQVINEDSEQIKRYQISPIKVENQQSNLKIIEEKVFNIKIQDFIDNLKFIGKEELLIPDFLFNNRSDNFKDTVSNYYDQILRVYEDFSDFRLKNSDEVILKPNLDKFNYYVKLVTKQIFFLIKLPSKLEYLNAVIHGRGEESSMEVQYYRATKKMIRISNKLAKSPYLHILNPNFHLNHEGQRERIQSHIQGSDQYLQNQNFSGEYEIQEIEDEYDEENINQIDQICDFIFYYQSDQIEGTQQLQFEPHVQTIIDNFCNYLKTNFEIVFAETVLLNLPNEDILNQSSSLQIQRTRKSSNNSNEENPLTSMQIHLQNDLKKIKKTMTKCRFKLDISFLCQMINEILVKQVNYIDGQIESQRIFKDALDEVFQQIVTRNFRQCLSDQELFVFKKNEQLDELGNYPELSQEQSKEQNNLSKPYLYNLEGTKDSYSDSEDESRRNNRKGSFSGLANSFNSKIQLGQNSCKKIMFKIDLIVKDLKGEIVLEKKLERLSELFDQANQSIISQVCNDISKKAQYIVEERRHEAKIIQENKLFLESDQFLDQFINEQTLFLSNQDSSREIHDHQQMLSAVEIYFSFYTIPQYVGIIRDQDIDYLCNKNQDEILVNDDDHEDLIRVSKLNNLLHNNNHQPHCLQQRLEFEDLTSFKENTWPLYKPFNKKQFVKSIPYYFKNSEKQAKDYRMYYYDEVQRKIIYGVLRRSYALIAQSFIEYLSLIKNDIDPLNIITLQKYMGALLSNQRKEFKCKVIDRLGNKTRQAMKFLTDELKQSCILNLNHIKITQDKNNVHDELFFIKSQKHLKNFFLKHQIERDQVQIPFNLFDNESEFQNEDQIQLKQYLTEIDELEIIENQQKKNQQQPFDIPFWLIFRLIHKVDPQTNQNSVYVECVYHLPQYKNHKYLNDNIIDQELQRCFDIISKRANVIFLLNQIDEFKTMPQNLIMNNHVDGIQNSNLSLMNHQQTMNRIEQNKSRTGLMSITSDSDFSKPSLTKTFSSQSSQQQMSTSQQSSQNQKQSSQITSKFKKRMGKLNQIPSGTEITSEQSWNNTKEMPNINFTPPNFKNPAEKQEIYKVNKVFQYIFPLKHSLIRVEDGISYVRKTLENYQIDNTTNLFVVKKDNNVYLIKIFGQNNIQGDQIGKQSMIKSFSQLQHHSIMLVGPHQTFNQENFQNNFFTNGMTGDDSLNSINKDHSVLASGMQNNQIKASQIGVNQHLHPIQSSIVMEVYSTQNCLKSHMLEEIKLIEINLSKMILEKLAKNLLNHIGTITNEDLNYIDGSDQKMIFAFPLGDLLAIDHYALIKYLKQNLSRFLIPIQLASNSKLSKAHLIQENTIEQNSQTQEIKRSDSISASTLQAFQDQKCEEFSNDEQFVVKKQQTVQYKQEDFQLLYNYRRYIQSTSNEKQDNKYNKHIRELEPLTVAGRHLGESLTIGTLSILQKFNPSEIFEQNDYSVPYCEEVQNCLKKIKCMNFQIEGSTHQNLDKKQIYGINKLVQENNSKSKIKISMPLIYHICKDIKGRSSSQKYLSTFRAINEQMKVPIPFNRDPNQKWLLVQLSILGQLEKENFSKNIILNVHQAISECMIEQFISANFNKENEPNHLSDKDNKNKINLFESKHLEQLEILLQQQTLSLTSMIEDFDILIYGDQSDIICTLISSFVTNFHSEFKLYMQNIKELNYLNNGWCLTLIIELINKNTNKLEKIIVYSFGENIFSHTYEQFQRELQIYLSKTKTILRNIHPQFKIILGSFKIQPNIDTNKTQLIYKDLTQQFQFDGLQPDYQVSPHFPKIDANNQNSNFQQNNQDDRLSCLKQYPDIIQKIDETSQQCIPRSFFLILSVKDQKLNFKSYNLDKTIIKRCKELIQDQLLWNSNRQNFLKRIVSQKLGTVYTLKDYYSSTHLIKDQTLDTLYQNNKYTYEKTATLIEGKQIYDFKRVIRRQRRKSRKQIDDYLPIMEEVPQKRKRKNLKETLQKDQQKDNPPILLSGALSLQVQGEEFLKQLKQEEDLNYVYKQIKNNKKPNPDSLKKVIENQASQQKPHQVEFMDLDIANKKGKKSYCTVPYIEFIQNKVIKKSLQHRGKNVELKLVNMYVISPSLQPSRANTILGEIDKYNQQEFLKRSLSKKHHFVDNLVSTSEHNNKLMVYNPIFFHGMRMIKMLKGYFQRVKNSQQLALIYTKCEDLVSRKFVTSKNLRQQEQFKKLFEKISAGQSIQNQLYEVEDLIGKSRLLYTNITQLLIDDGHFHNYEENNNASFIGQFEHSNFMTKRQLEDMRKNLLTEYNNFLLSKIGVKSSVCFMFSSNPNDQQLISQKSHKINNSSLNSIKKQLLNEGLYGDDDYIGNQFSKTHLNPKLKKNSEDFQESLDSDKPQLLNHHGSNSSLVVSSHNQDSYYTTQLFSKTRKERVLQEISEEGNESQQKLYSYIVKTLFDDSIIIYELKYQNSLIRINVYQFDSMIKTFPRNIFSDYNIYFSDINVRRDKREMLVKEAHYLSTRLNSDSFNYDFHLKEISNQISLKSKKSFNVSQQLLNIISYYKSPPKFAKNFIDVVVLKFDLGEMNGIKDVEFLSYFCSRHKLYQFKILTEPSQKSALQTVQQKYSASMIGQVPLQSLTGSPSKHDEDFKGEKVQYSFFKEEGLKPKVENLDHNMINKRSTSVVFQPSQYPQASRERKYSNNNLERVEERNEDIYDRQNFRNDSELRKSTFKQNSSYLGKNQEPTSKKLFYVELMNSAIHHEFDNDNSDIYKKVWNVQCRKQESTVSEISQNEEEKDNKTIIELVFYMIYTVPLTNNQVDLNGLQQDLRTNSERYPLRDISQDMNAFIDSLETAFSECRKELIKDHLWQRFFDPSKKNPLTDAQIHDMLKFSYQSDIRLFDERYKNIFTMNLYKSSFNDYLRKISGKKCYPFNNNLQLVGQAIVDQQLLPDLLILNPEITNALIHVEFNFSSKIVNVYLVSKDYKKYNETHQEFGSQPTENQQLEQKSQVKKLINHITFWLWKKAITK